MCSSMLSIRSLFAEALLPIWPSIQHSQLYGNQLTQVTDQIANPSADNTQHSLMSEEGVEDCLLKHLRNLHKNHARDVKVRGHLATWTISCLISSSIVCEGKERALIERSRPTKN